MERIEMIEKLRELADVNYGEAKEALDQANDDLLEAIVILEKKGKVRKTEVNAGGKEKAAGENSEKSKAKRVSGTIAEAIRSAWNFLCHTRFHITRNGKEFFVMPSLVLALAVFCFFYTIIPIMLIAMLFNVRYSFTGSEGADKANKVLNKAGDIAEDVKKTANAETAENA